MKAGRAAALLLLAALFLAPRMGLLLTVDGSYIDEYKHLVSSVEIFESGRFARIYDAGVSYRGAHMTIWAGLWMWLFGKSLLVAKLSALALATLAFALWVDVARRTFRRPAATLVFGALYAFHPWLVFNATYVRMYVVYELFLAALAWLAWHAVAAFEEGRARRGYAALAALVLVNVLNAGLSHDQGQYVLLAGTAVVFCYLFLFRVRYFSSALSWLRAGFLERRSWARAGLVAATGVLGFFVFDVHGSLRFLVDGVVPFTAPVPGYYRAFFFDENAVATTLFALALTSWPFVAETFWKVLLPIAGGLFALHLLSADEAHVLRAVLYFLPLYLLVACFALDRLSHRKAALPALVFGAALAFATARQYPEDFALAPGLPGEINYIDYRTAYDVVKERCRGRTVVEASPEVHVAAFHGVRVDHVLVRPGSGELERHLYGRGDDGHYSVHGRVPVIRDLAEAGPGGLCLVVRQPSRRRFVTVELERRLAAEAEAVELTNITVYVLGRGWRGA